LTPLKEKRIKSIVLNIVLFHHTFITKPRGDQMAVSRYKIKHFDVVSVGKIGAVVGLIIGFIYGIIFAFVISLFGAAAVSSSGFGPFVAFGALFMFLIFFIGGAIAGFIGGVIYAFIYNVAASFVGPIEVDLET
jgi:hypothetical protein